MKLNMRKTALIASALIVGSLVVAGATTRVFKSKEDVTLPAGTTITVWLNHALASDTHHTGDTFAATVSDPIVLQNKVVVPSGTAARGHVVEARESGRLKTPAVLLLALDEIQVDGDWYDVETAITGRRGKSHKKRNWLWIGGSSAGGALIGALAGGGAGAAIGAGAGAGAGTAAAAITGKQEIRFPAEAQLRFRLTEPAKVEVADRKS